MIILDLTEYHGKRPSSWPDNMPLKIRLIKGKHECDYDFHPNHRRTKWYKELVRRRRMEQPERDLSLPMGVWKHQVSGGAKIIEVK